MGVIPNSYTGDRLFGALQYILVHKGTFLPAEMLLYEGVEASPNREPAAKTLTEDSTVDPKSLGLTPRQADVLYLVLQGSTTSRIAELEAITKPYEWRDVSHSLLSAALRQVSVTPPQQNQTIADWRRGHARGKCTHQ